MDRNTAQLLFHGSAVQDGFFASANQHNGWTLPHAANLGTQHTQHGPFSASYAHAAAQMATMHSFQGASDLQPAHQAQINRAFMPHAQMDVGHPPGHRVNVTPAYNASNVVPQGVQHLQSQYFSGQTGLHSTLMRTHPYTIFGISSGSQEQAAHYAAGTLAVPNNSDNINSQISASNARAALSHFIGRNAAIAHISGSASACAPAASSSAQTSLAASDKRKQKRSGPSYITRMAGSVRDLTTSNHEIFRGTVNNPLMCDFPPAFAVAAHSMALQGINIEKLPRKDELIKRIL